MKNRKFLFWFVFLASIAMLVTSAVLLIITLITGNDPNARLTSHIASIGLNLLVLVLLLRQKTSNHFLLTYASIYILLAVFLGASLNFYNMFEHINYDKLIHVYFGYSATFVGLLLLNKLDHYKDSKTLFVLVFIFSFSMMIAAVWEMFEFTSDQLFNTVTQGRPYFAYDGRRIVDVGETMFDIIANFIGTILFMIQFSLTRKKAITEYMIASSLK